MVILPLKFQSDCLLLVHNSKSIKSVFLCEESRLLLDIKLHLKMSEYNHVSATHTFDFIFYKH